jgi:uncharacterized protein (TIGR02217 family)
MSNAIFPTFPGLTWSVFKAPEWKTRVQQSVNGKEIRTAYRSRPIWKFTLSYEVLRNYLAFTEYNQLLAFYNLRQGTWDSFLFLDPSDNVASAQPFGTGDGVTTVFPLLHTIQGWTEPIGYTNNASIYSNGTFQSSGVGYVLNNSAVSFAVAPAAGVALTWTGNFYYRVRFMHDSMDFEQFMKDFWSLKKCEMVGVI